MTTTFGTDANNDLFLGDGANITVLTGALAVAGACSTATKAQLGEMVLANDTGIPTFQTVWVGSPNYALYTDYLRTTLMNIPGVQEVVMLNLTISGDVLSYQATIKTEFGTLPITGAINNG